MSAKSGHILVVEDDPDIRESIVEILQDEGYTVSFAADGREGLDALEARPDLVLLDLMMPNLNGYEFRDLQLAGAHKDVPVALITADGHEKQKSERIQAAGYMRKPVKVQPLLDLVARLLEASRSRGAIVG